MSRTGRFLGGVAFGYLNQALLVLVGLWLTPFLLARLGQIDYGLWLVAAQILSYLLLADLGVVGLLPRETAFTVGKAGGDAGASEVPALLGRTLRLVLWQMPVVAVAALAVWVLLPAKWEALRPALAPLLVAFVALFPFRLFTAALQGLQDLAALGRVQLVCWLAGTATTVGLVYAGVGLPALVAGWTVQQALAAVWLGARLARRWRQVLPRRLPRVDGSWARDYLARGGWISAGQLAQAMLNATDLLIVGAALGPAAVVPYACTGKLVTVLANQPQMLLQTAIPALAELRYAESRRRLAEVSGALTLALLLASGAVAVVILAVNRAFVGWWVGSELWAGLPVAGLLLANMLLRHFNSTAVFAVFCFGYERFLSLVTLADGAVTVGASIALVRWLGPVGAPLGMVVGVCLVSLPANLTALARETGTTVAGRLRLVAPWGWRFALLAAGAVALDRMVELEGIVEIGAAAVGAGLVYAGVMWPLALREPLGAYVRPRLAALRGWRRWWRRGGKEGGAG